MDKKDKEKVGLGFGLKKYFASVCLCHDDKDNYVCSPSCCTGEK